MLQGEHSAILSSFIKLPFAIKIFVLSIFEWPLNVAQIIIFTLYPQDALGVMGFIAIVVNTALIGVSGQIQRNYSDIDTTSIFIIIVVVEVRPKTYVSSVKTIAGQSLYKPMFGVQRNGLCYK